MIVAGALALIGALSLIRLLIRSMRGPLDALVAATRRLAEGDLTQTVEPSGPAELRDLGEAFNAMARDLQRATATLEQERARLATTIASLGDGLLVTAPDSTTVVAANPRAAVLVPEVPPGHRADAPESPLPPLAEAQAHEVTIEHAGRTLAVTAAPLGTADAHAGTVWTVRDISERARLEQAKSDFVATASHELRSPLTSIKGFVELLASAPGEMSARQREFVDIILRSTDRLVDLVNDLLDVARIEADHVEINRRPVDAGDAVREVVELMGPRVTDKRQTLECQVAPALPPAMADPARLRQIVANLLTNAHLYTPEGGRITVTADGDGPWVRVAISDTGIGMSADEVERVFERFYRGSDGRTAPGTGLGLSIVKSLVDLHEGRIEVSSQPGAGTTFRVLIPSASTALGLAPSIDALRGRQVLVVDDEREVAQLIADQLTPFGLHCTIAGGGEEALEMLGRGGFDVVTLDVKMPGVSGFDVLRQIRAHPELRRTPVVFVSVFADHRRLRGEWVVSKPIDAEELRGVLSAAVSSGRSRVLVVARPELQETLERSLHDLGIEHQWATSGQAAARLCGERRFEIALIDIGLRNPQAVLHALDLRGRRVRRAVVLVADSASPVPPAIERLGLEVVPLTEAARVLQDAMRSDPGVAAR
jgi:signal transduction histidine kinase/DNA-binding response OmpR family regulator